MYMEGSHLICKVREHLGMETQFFFSISVRLKNFFISEGQLMSMSVLIIYRHWVFWNSRDKEYKNKCALTYKSV